MQKVNIYKTFSGQSFDSPEYALSQEHDDAAEVIHNIIKALPHSVHEKKFLRDLTLAIVPLPSIERFGINLDDVVACRKKVEIVIDVLTKYSSSLSDFLTYKGEE